MVKLTNIDEHVTLGVVFHFFEIQPLDDEINKLRDELCIGDALFKSEYPTLFKFFEFAQAKARYDREYAEYLLEEEQNNF